MLHFNVSEKVKNTFLLFTVIALVAMIVFFVIREIGFPSNLPGTGLEDSQPLILSYSVWIILITFPIVSIYFLISIYRDINNLSETEFKSKINSLPNEVQEKIINNLKAIMQKLNQSSNDG